MDLPFGNRRLYFLPLYQLKLLEPEKLQFFSQRLLESARNNFSHLWKLASMCSSMDQKIQILVAC